MAKLQTTCPQCNSPISVYSEWAGKQATCPICRSPITVPAVSADAINCPSCGKDLQGQAPGYQTCSACGETIFTTPGLSFKCADTLPPSPDGIPRIACPHCSRHYILSFTPKHGLIGCQDCMNIFACPAPPAPPQPVQERSAYTTMVLTPAPIQAAAPAPAAASPQEAAIQTMMLTPKPLPPQVDLTPQTNQTMPLTPPQPQAEEKTVLLSAVPNPDYTASASGSFNKNSAKQMNGEAGSKLQSIFSFCEKHLQKK